jgi:predicted ATPase
MMREWIEVCRTMRTECLMPTYLAWLAEMYGRNGQPEEGLVVVSDALAVTSESGYQHWTAELHRLRGTLTLAAGAKGASSSTDSLRRDSARDSDEVAAQAVVERSAEACFLEALDVAGRQRAKSLELRAAMSVSRLWARQGRTSEARALLGNIYRWFTEGFDTADLKEARLLLGSLGDPQRQGAER